MIWIITGSTVPVADGGACSGEGNLDLYLEGFS